MKGIGNLKTKRISFDIDEDTLNILKTKAKNDHRTLASYLRVLLFEEAYSKTDDNESHANDEEVDENIGKDEVKQECETKVEPKIEFSSTKPKLKGGL